jgi:hypothetical protein
MNWLKEKIANFLFGFVLEKIPFVKDINGAKTQIGQLAIGVGIVVDGVSAIIHGLAASPLVETFPQLGMVETKWAVLAGTITIVVGKVLKMVGDAHANYKAEKLEAK